MKEYQAKCGLAGRGYGYGYGYSYIIPQYYIPIILWNNITITITITWPDRSEKYGNTKVLSEIGAKSMKIQEYEAKLKPSV